MNWSYPDLSLEDLLKLFKGFVDLLILASGYQSSGCEAYWDVQNIKRAFQWGLFFENVLRNLRCSENSEDSFKELDSALSEITSNPLFPQGLAHISAATLHRARDIVLEHLIHALPLREKHLRAIAEASIEMDLDELSITEINSLGVYLDKLAIGNTSMSRDPGGKDPIVSSQDIQNGDFTKSTIRELMTRQSSVLCISSVEAGLDILHKSVKQSNADDFDCHSYKELVLNSGSYTLSEEHLIEYQTWSRWRAQAISYFLDMGTLRLVSGASMIFSAPLVQWIQVFERMNAASEINGGHLNHLFEILLLGCVARRWSSLIEHVISMSYSSLSTLEQYHEVCSLVLGRSRTLYAKDENVNAEEKAILEHLTTLTRNKLHHFWNLPPILAAVAIPSWSPLFRLYLSEIDIQLKGDRSTIRHCSCIEGRMEHKECEIAERIWCLYMYQVRGSHLTM